MNHSVIRLTRELSELQKSNDLSIAVACKDVDVRNVRALILGPPDTPYQFGFYEFSMRFGRDYPGKAPTVTGLTTNAGRTRFNPNIYAGGKVCLSILGTWRGERGEEWSSAQGMESILISIQSLLSSNPYENEPGFENATTDADKSNMKAYACKIRHENIRISVIQRLEDYLGLSPDGTRPAPDAETDGEVVVPDDASFEPFVDLIKRRFLWYYDSYLATIATEQQYVAEGEQFVKMPFEHVGNTMEGKFLYSVLEKRLGNIRAVLDEEPEQWAQEGKIAASKDVGVAVNLQRQFEQTVEHYKKNDSVTVDLELVDGNPFVWKLTYFGRPMTNLDGGLFNIQINFSPRFPDEQPRAKFLTPIYHHRITKDGIPCYFPKKSEEAKSHIEAIIQTLEEENPPYDPRMQVNLEASKLYWGSKEDKREYNKKLRRAVQRSMEC
ncbi:ubiquitin-conjugating enzyme/RWD-like protein [Kalaharituber pfeilii]|nr:ubiquitin-conjugating enzyme/RWD-like protein [Kalaharituber pfeilii]